MLSLIINFLLGIYTGGILFLILEARHIFKFKYIILWPLIIKIYFQILAIETFNKNHPNSQKLLEIVLSHWYEHMLGYKIFKKSFVSEKPYTLWFWLKEDTDCVVSNKGVDFDIKVIYSEDNKPIITKLKSNDDRLVKFRHKIFNEEVDIN